MAVAGLRIIAGRLRGRRIRVPPGAMVRPTPERVREALFSILGPVLPDAAVLDAFAGAGALGFEALSRGAVRVVFIESDRRVAAGIRASAADLGLLSACRVVEGHLPGALLGARSGISGPFDVILADPPYAASPGERQEFLAALAGVLDPAGVLVMERRSRDPATRVAELHLEASRRYGNSSVDLYRSAAQACGPVESPPETGG